MYACHQDELIVIKEQGYLQKEVVEEKYLDSQSEKRVVDLQRGNNPPLPTKVTGDSPKIPLTPTLEDEGANISRESEEG